MSSPTSLKQNPIKFSCISSNISQDAPLKLKFVFKDIDHAIYGKVTGLGGELPLLLTKRSLIISKYFEFSAAEQKVVLDRFVKRVGHLHEDLDEEELRTKFLAWVIATAATDPFNHPKGEIFEAGLDFMAAIFHGDDIVDEDGILENLEINTSFLFKRYPIWERIFAGEYEKFGEIMRTIPQMEPASVVTLNCLKTIDKHVADTRKNLVYTMKSAFVTAQGGMLSLDKSKSGSLSEEARKVLRNLDSGGEPGIEFLAVSLNITVPAYIRESLLFKFLIEGIMVISGLCNDLLGVQKDIEKSATDQNFILRRVVNEGISLEESFSQALKRQQNTSNDIKIVSKKLLEAFPEEKGLADFVRISIQFHDGYIYSYFLLSEYKLRYGSTEMEIVPSD